MKSILTLVPDIYDVLRNGTDINEDDLKEFTDNLGELLRKRLGKDKDGKTELRMSNFGTPCQRELWFRINKPESAEPIQPWVLFKFMYGDILEHLVLFLAKHAGHKVEGEQDELEISGLVGHRDAVIDGVLVDVKSANSRGMAKFRDHALLSDDPFGYIDQLSLYLSASQKDPLVEVKGEAAFLAVDKEMGHMVLDTYKSNKVDYEKQISRTRGMLAESYPPPRPYMAKLDGKSGNMVLDTKCSYCPHKHLCWSDANGGQGLIQYNYSTGPKFFTNISREPKVERHGASKAEDSDTTL